MPTLTTAFDIAGFADAGDRSATSRSLLIVITGRALGENCDHVVAD
ncbi:MAG: hypothetical protein ACJ76X_14450 [Solirubrobacteraceae bacterium]|jgi:hypothetical protein